jgi:Holliday junction resolvase RusA-like endonuclease
MIRTITIPGPPMGKPRMTQRDKWKQRDCVMRYRSWADVARFEAGSVPPAEQVERLDWVAYFEPPPSWSKAKKAEAIGQLHRSKPDRDNIDKAVLDALFKSDSGIAVGTLEKRWGVPARLEITITTA